MPTRNGRRRALRDPRALVALAPLVAVLLSLAGCIDDRVPLGADRVDADSGAGGEGRDGGGRRGDGGAVDADAGAEDGGAAGRDAGTADGGSGRDAGVHPCDLPDACGPLPPSLPCGPLTAFTIVDHCVPVEGTSPIECAWERVECPCEVAWCPELPDEPACADGLSAFGDCVRDDTERCAWERLGCPAVGEPCRGTDPCGVEPPGRPCGGDPAPRESTPGECLVTEADVCDWVATSCECDPARCGLPPPADPCVDGGIPWWCSLQGDGTCDWEPVEDC